MHTRQSTVLMDNFNVCIYDTFYVYIYKYTHIHISMWVNWMNGVNYIHKLVWIHARQSTISKDTYYEYIYMYMHIYISVWVNWSELEWMEWITYIIWYKCITSINTRTSISVSVNWSEIEWITYVNVSEVEWTEWITYMIWYKYIHAKIPLWRIPFTNPILSPMSLCMFICSGMYIHKRPKIIFEPNSLDSFCFVCNMVFIDVKVPFCIPIDGMYINQRQKLFSNPIHLHRYICVRELEWNGAVWSGLEWNGLKWSGLEWIWVNLSEFEWIGLNWSEMDWVGVIWSEFEWHGVYWTELEWIKVKWSELE